MWINSPYHEMGVSVTDTVYKNYTKEQLDSEYNNQTKVTNFKNFVAEWAALSATARDEHPNTTTWIYDDASNQKLDIVYPAAASLSEVPVQIFFHGGYWKALSRENFYFVARAFADHGIATAIVDYELIPQIDMAELIRQCRQSIAYIYQNATALGLDSSEIHISGHSAGGHIAAMCLATDWSELQQELPAQIVKSAVGVSGLYDLMPISKCFLQDDLKLTSAEVADMSPVNLTPPKAGKMHCLVGAKEGPEYFSQSENLAENWPHISQAPDILEPYNHFTIMSAFADPTSAPARLIRAAMQSNEE